METESETYPARLDVDYPEKLDRLSSFFRLIWLIPIVISATHVGGSTSRGNSPVSGRG